MQTVTVHIAIIFVLSDDFFSPKYPIVYPLTGLPFCGCLTLFIILTYNYTCAGYNYITYMYQFNMDDKYYNQYGFIDYQVPMTNFITTVTITATCNDLD